MPTPMLPPGSQVPGAHENPLNTMRPKVAPSVLGPMAPCLAFITWQLSCGKTHPKNGSICAPEKRPRTSFSNRVLPGAALIKKVLQRTSQGDESSHSCKPCQHTLARKGCTTQWHPAQNLTYALARVAPFFLACQLVKRVAPVCQVRTCVFGQLRRPHTTSRNSLSMTQYTRNLEILPNVHSSLRDVRIQAYSTTDFFIHHGNVTSWQFFPSKELISRVRHAAQFWLG